MLAASLERAKRFHKEESERAADFERKSEAAKAKLTHVSAQLEAEQNAHKATKDALARMRRDLQAIKASALQYKAANDRSVARVRARIGEVTSSAIRSAVPDFQIVASAFDDLPTSSSTRGSAASAYAQQVQELEQKRTSLVEYNQALKRLATDAINAARRADQELLDMVEAEQEDAKKRDAESAPRSAGTRSTSSGSSAAMAPRPERLLRQTRGSKDIDLSSKETSSQPPTACARPRRACLSPHLRAKPCIPLCALSSLRRQPSARMCSRFWTSEPNATFTKRRQTNDSLPSSRSRRGSRNWSTASMRICVTTRVSRSTRPTDQCTSARSRRPLRPHQAAHRQAEPRSASTGSAKSRSWKRSLLSLSNSSLSPSKMLRARTRKCASLPKPNSVRATCSTRQLSPPARRTRRKRHSLQRSQSEQTLSE